MASSCGRNGRSGPSSCALRAQEQDSGENLWRRQAWWEQVSQLDPACLVFLDESGVTTEMTRRYGWAPRPERVSEAVPAGHWRTLTVSAALATTGMLASMTIESPTDGDVFLAFVEQVLAPRLEPGHVVILDNLSAHKVAGVRQLIEDRGGIAGQERPSLSYGEAQVRFQAEVCEPIRARS